MSVDNELYKAAQSLVETKTGDSLRKELLNDSWELQVHQLGVGGGEGYCYLSYVKVVDTGDCFDTTTLKVTGFGCTEVDALCECISQVNALNVYLRKFAETRDKFLSCTTTKKPAKGRSLETALTMVNRESGLALVKSRRAYKKLDWSHCS